MSSSHILVEYVERECLRLFDARGQPWIDYSTPDRPGNHFIERHLLNVCGCVVGPNVNEAALLQMRMNLGNVRSTPISRRIDFFTFCLRSFHSSFLPMPRMSFPNPLDLSGKNKRLPAGALAANRKG